MRAKNANRVENLRPYIPLLSVFIVILSMDKEIKKT